MIVGGMFRNLDALKLQRIFALYFVELLYGDRLEELVLGLFALLSLKPKLLVDKARRPCGAAWRSCDDERRHSEECIH